MQNFELKYCCCEHASLLRARFGAVAVLTLATAVKRGLHSKASGAPPSVPDYALAMIQLEFRRDQSKHYLQPDKHGRLS